MSKAQLYFITALLFALAVALFAIQNPETISINFLAWEYNEISKVIVILGSTAVGALVVMFLGFWWQLKKLMYIRQLEGELRELKSKLAETTGAGAGTKNEVQACPAGSTPGESAAGGKSSGFPDVSGEKKTVRVDNQSS